MFKEKKNMAVVVVGMWAKQRFVQGMWFLWVTSQRLSSNIHIPAYP